jgi:hypothetical protein
MFAPGVDGWPSAGCPGCSMVVDYLGPLQHLHARDTSLALVSRAPLANLESYKHAWVGRPLGIPSDGTDFNDDFGVSTAEGETFGLSVFLRQGDDVFHTYFTTDRGLEVIDSNFTLLDWTPLGRQEAWEDSPAISTLRVVAPPRRVLGAESAWIVRFAPVMYPAAAGHAIDHRSNVFFLRGVVSDGLVAKPCGTGVIATIAEDLKPVSAATCLCTSRPLKLSGWRLQTLSPGDAPFCSFSAGFGRKDFLPVEPQSRLSFLILLSESWKTTNEYGFLGAVDDSRFLIEQGVCSNEIWRTRISRAILSISC